VGMVDFVVGSVEDWRMFNTLVISLKKNESALLNPQIISTISELNKLKFLWE
jgi:hypothetical protein